MTSAACGFAPHEYDGAYWFVHLVRTKYLNWQADRDGFVHLKASYLQKVLGSMAHYGEELLGNLSVVANFLRWNTDWLDKLLDNANAFLENANALMLRPPKAGK